MQVVYLIAVVLLLLCLLLVGRLRQREGNLRDSERRFATFMDNTPSIAFIRSADGRMVYLNAYAEQRFAIEPTDWPGRADFVLWPSEVPGMERDKELIVQERKRISTVETVTHPDGSTTYWLSHKFPLHDDRGKNYLGGIAIEITEQKRLEDELRQANTRLERLSLIDGLTGLNNRRAFDEALNREVDRANRYSRPLSLLLLDIDHFKSYNDTWGHLAGDDVLRQVGQVLQASARITDIAARYGGEEFAVILPDTDSAGAVAFAERLRVTLEQTAWSHRTVTASIGVAVWNEGTNGQELASCADAHLYRAKQNGRNQIAYRAPDETPTLTTNLPLTAEQSATSSR